jgi:hypothetical protein
LLFELARRHASLTAAAAAALVQNVPRAACIECADTLLLLDLRRWPRTDAVLLEGARAALAQQAQRAAK